MNKRVIRLRDMADKLNMSVSTVSRALIGYREMSPMTIERVQKLAKEWNYIPNEMARNFKQKKSFKIGLIVPSILDEFFAVAINGIQSIVDGATYHLIISQSANDPSIEKKMIEGMKKNRVDGILIATSARTQDFHIFQELKNMGIPVVFLGRKPAAPDFDYVVSDTENAAFEMTNYMINRGHKRIGFISERFLPQKIDDKLKGFLEALKTNNIPHQRELIKTADNSFSSIGQVMKQFLAMPEPPTAILSYRNCVTLEAAKFLAKSNGFVSKKVEFFGFDNLTIFQYTVYKPTILADEDPFQIAVNATNLLLNRIKEQEEEDTDMSTHKVVLSALLHSYL